MTQKLRTTRRWRLVDKARLRHRGSRKDCYCSVQHNDRAISFDKSLQARTWRLGYIDAGACQKRALLLRELTRPRSLPVEMYDFRKPQTQIGLGMCTTEAPWSLALGFVAPELTDTKVGLRDEGATCERTGQGRERQGRTPEQREAKADGGIDQE